jgi:hypothetical protein
MAMEDRHNVFFFHFLSIDILAKFDPKIAKLGEFTRKKIQNFSQLLWKKWRNFARK